MKGQWPVAVGLMIVLGIGTMVVAAESESERDAAGRLASSTAMTRSHPSPDPRLNVEPTVDQPPTTTPDFKFLKWLASDSLVTNPTVDEGKPSIASAPDGHLFVAVDELGTGRILIYHSTDGGLTWSWLISFVHGSNSRNPALAYAEDSGQKWLVVVYELVVSDSSRSLAAFRVDPDNTANSLFTTIEGSIVWTTPSNELHPQITTDFPDYTTDVYFYVTYAKPSIDYYPVFFARSTDLAATWSTPENITGGSENTGLESRPEIAYSAYSEDIYVAFSKPGWTGSEWAQQVWVTSNSNYGAAGSWGTPVQVSTSARRDYQPSIAAAWASDTLVVLFTSEFGVDDNDVQFATSTNGGTSWSARVSMPGWSFDNEDHVDLAASQVAAGRFHAVYRQDLPDPLGGNAWYSWASFASPGMWSDPVDVDEGAEVSGPPYYPRPAIGINPSVPPENEAAVAWTSFRGPYYDVYFDSPALIFADGFESGDTTAWSTTVP